MEWAFDAQVESTPLTTTGGHTWKAAYRLADYLAAAAPQLGLAAEDVNVLELGSGTGWLGVTVARNLPAARLVCLTEQAGGLSWLRHNVELNRGRGLPLDHVRVQACDWLEFAEPGWRGVGRSGAGNAGSSSSSSSSSGGSLPGGSSGGSGPQPSSPRPNQADQLAPQGGDAAPAGGAAGSSAPAGAAAGEGRDAEAGEVDLRSVKWDFIIGSDLIYNEVGSRCLPRVLAALAGPATRVLYCHTKHRYDLLDLEFFEQLDACGLDCQEVWEPSAAPPPSSPPVQFPPVDLFPEQRIAVFSITKRAAA